MLDIAPFQHSPEKPKIEVSLVHTHIKLDLAVSPDLHSTWFSYWF